MSELERAEHEAARTLARLYKSSRVVFYAIPLVVAVTAILILSYSSVIGEVKQFQPASFTQTSDELRSSVQFVSDAMAKVGPIVLSVLHTVVAELYAPSRKDSTRVVEPHLIESGSKVTNNSSSEGISPKPSFATLRTPPQPAVLGVPRSRQPQQDDVLGLPSGQTLDDIPIGLDRLDFQQAADWPETVSSLQDQHANNFWKFSSRYEAFFYRWFGRQRRRCLAQATVPLHSESQKEPKPTQWTTSQMRAQAEIYAHQFPRPEACQNKRFLIVEPYRAGIGAMFQVLSSQLALAIKTNRILLVYDRRWPYAAGCHSWFSHDNINERRSKRAGKSTPAHADWSAEELREADAVVAALATNGITPGSLARLSQFDINDPNTSIDSRDFESGGLGCFIEPISSCTLADTGLSEEQLRYLGCRDRLITSDKLTARDRMFGWTTDKGRPLSSVNRITQMRTDCSTIVRGTTKNISCKDALLSNERVVMCTREDDPRKIMKSPELSSTVVPFKWAQDEGLDVYWWRAQSVRFFLRPTPWLVRELETRFTKALQYRAGHAHALPLREPPKSIGPMVSVHVRHGDKVREAAPLDWQHYKKRIAALVLSMPRLYQPRSMFLSTDDPTVIESALRVSNDSGQVDSLESKLKLIFLKHTRDNSAASDLRDGSRMGVTPFGTEEALIAFSNLMLAARSQLFVCTLTSNWCHLINQLRLTRGDCTAPFVDVEDKYELVF